MVIPSILFTFEALLLIYAVTFIVASVASFICIRAITTHNIAHHIFITIILLAVIIGSNISIGILLSKRVSQVPKISQSIPANNQILPVHSSTIHLEFSEPIVYSALQIHTFPENEITITPERYFYPNSTIGRKLIISPKKPFTPGTQVMIYISNIKGPLTHGFGGEQLIELNAETLPKIVSLLSPTLFSDVPTSQDIRLLLDKPSETYSTWNIQSTPLASFAIHYEKNELLIQPTTPLKQGTTYTVSLSQIPLAENQIDSPVSTVPPSIPDRSITFSTISPPFIQTISPSGQTIYPDEDIIIDFKQAMNILDSKIFLSIVPQTEHKVIWERKNMRMRISHNSFPKNSSISVTLSKGFRTESGGVLEQDIRYDFITPGQLNILASSPENLQKESPVDSSIQIQFNQPISDSTIQKYITVNPIFPFTLSASESSVIISPTKPLNTNTIYTVTISPNAQPVHGFPPENALTLSFSTIGDRVVLPVPYFKQESPFTCNIAAVRMLLAYKNITVSERDIIQRIGTSDVRGKGNPYLGYIIDYGTYWDAISKGISGYSANTVIKNGTLKQLTSIIATGKPVMVWGQNGWSDPHDISWTTPDGKYIKAINGMHSSVIRGFRGTADNPTEIYLNDPWRGQYSISTKEFLRRWGYFSVALVLQ